MTYQETLDYLFAQLPMFQRVGASAYKVDLSNTVELCNLLDNPQNKFKSIHVAGTNGKGSTSHMLASILQESGYKVGLYTSPHLVDFRERIKINGKMIPEQYVVDFVVQYKDDFEKIKLSFFEWTVGLAFKYFSEQNIDFAIVETGLGGRLDSTNIIKPELSIITNIGKDHVQFLGDTLEKIAYEKAGIIKQDVPVIIGETQTDIQHVFIESANLLNANIYFADQIINKVLDSDLRGSYQAKNIKTVLAAINELKKVGFKILDNDIKIGLLNVVKNSGLMGRWQTLNENPKIICDTGHNEAGIKEVVSQLKGLKFNQLHFVIGVVNDKEIDSILVQLPKNALYYFCQAKIPRALNVEELQQKAIYYGLKGNIYNSVIEALNTAKDAAVADDLIFVGGSTFVVAEVLQ